MKITVFGSGYVGLVVASCLAEVGNDVVCVDVDQQKVDHLNAGIVPIYEPGLEAVLKQALKSQKIRFTTDARFAVEHGLCQFIAVGTPSDEHGNADLTYVLEVAQVIGQFRNEYTLVVNKSTVPIGSQALVKNTIQSVFDQRLCQSDFDVASNPEFLKEGMALNDFRCPDRIVLGVDSEQAEKILRSLYAPFSEEDQRILSMSPKSAELTKYAANALLATKISFMNEIANLAEKVGADIEEVRSGISLDPRIGPHFIQAGCGYGGSCFGKDVQALIHTAIHNQSSCEIIQATHNVNERQKNRIFDKVNSYFGEDLNGKTLAIWGLAFKPETDDVRDAPSLKTIASLHQKGAIIRAYDPKANKEARKNLSFERLEFFDDPYQALKQADALILLTEWQQFKAPDFTFMKTLLKSAVIFDGRNVYNPLLLKVLGFRYFGIGRGSDLSAAGRKHDVLARQEIPSKCNSHSD